MLMTRATVILFLVAALLFGGALSIRAHIEGRHDSDIGPAEILFVPHSGFLKSASLGLTELVADYWWLKSIQYFGDEKFPSNAHLRQLYTLIDLVTDLAPNFGSPYRFGAVTVTINDANGDLAVKLLEKGVRNLPQEWQIPYFLGYVYYFLLNDAAKAAVWYDHAGLVAVQNGEPGLAWLRTLARKLRIDASNPGLMFPVLEKMYREEPDPVIRKKYQRKYIEGMRKRNILYLQAEVDRFTADKGHPPRDLEELAETGFTSGTPADMESGKYMLNGSTVEWKP